MFKLGFLANGEMLAWDYNKLCEFVKNSGYDSIELIDDIIFSQDKTEKDNQALCKAVQENGLKISEVLLQHDLVVLDDEQRKANENLIINNIKKVADIGVDTVNLFSGPIPWMPNPVIVNGQISQGKAWDMVLSSFDKFVTVAEKYGVKLAVENVWGMLVHDFYTNSYLQSKFNSKYLGVNLDVSHDVLYGNTDVKFLVKAWGEKIFHVHLKDAVGVPELGKFTFPVIGEGNVNFNDLFASLKEIGYNGTASVEFESWAYRNTVWNGNHAPSAPAMREILKKYL